MAYIYENSNAIRFVLKDLASGSLGRSQSFDGNAKYKAKSENKQILNINQEILIDQIGMRMEIEVSLINRTNINTQSNITRLFDWINKVQAGTHRIIIYPSYSSEYNINTLDKFECIVNGYYDIKKLHKFLRSGQEIVIKFKEYIPNKLFIPKIPSTSTGGAIPRVPGGGVAG